MCAMYAPWCDVPFTHITFSGRTPPSHAFMMGCARASVGVPPPGVFLIDTWLHYVPPCSRPLARLRQWSTRGQRYVALDSLAICPSRVSMGLERRLLPSDGRHAEEQWGDMSLRSPSCAAMPTLCFGCGLETALAAPRSGLVCTRVRFACVGLQANIVCARRRLMCFSGDGIRNAFYARFLDFVVVGLFSLMTRSLAPHFPQLSFFQPSPDPPCLAYRTSPICFKSPYVCRTFLFIITSSLRSLCPLALSHRRAILLTWLAGLYYMLRVFTPPSSRS